MKWVFVGVLHCAFLLAPAAAADKPTKAPDTKVHSWNGWYLGANLGGAWANLNATASGFGLTASASERLDGVIVGIQSGYDWQFGPWVLGLDSDIQWSGQSGAMTLFGTAYSDRIEWFTTSRIRFGYALDRWLWYVSAGMSWGPFRSRATTAGVTTTTTTYQSAWVFGSGAEFVLTGHWTGRIEHLYLDTGDITDTAGGITATGRMKTNIVRAGVNYRF